MNENDMPERVENFHSETTEEAAIAAAVADEKPKKLPLLFGERFNQNAERRTNLTAIGRRVSKLTRRIKRREVGQMTRKRGMYTIGTDGDGKAIKRPALGAKAIMVDRWLAQERVEQNKTGKLATNSHERARVIAEDQECRRNVRKEMNAQEYLKRTTAGEVLQPMGVQPARAERKAERKLMRKAAKAQLRANQLEARMYAAIGSPSIVSSPTTTEESAET